MIRHTKSTQSVKNKIGQQSKKNSMVNLREVLTYKDSRKKQNKTIQSAISMKLKSDRVPVTKNKRGKVKGENDKVKLELENLKKLFVEDKNKICAMIKEISRHKSSKKIQKENRVSKNHEGSCLKQLQRKLYQVRIKREKLSKQKQIWIRQEKQKHRQYESLLKDIRNIKKMSK